MAPGPRRCGARPLAAAMLWRGAEAQLHDSVLHGLEALRQSLAPHNSGFAAQVLLGLGDRTFARGDHLEAAAAYRAALGRGGFLSTLAQEEAGEAARKLADSLLSLRALEQAAHWYQAALALSPASESLEQAQLQERLGDVRGQQLRWATALEHFKRAERLEGRAGRGAERAGAGEVLLVGDAVEVEEEGGGEWRPGHVVAIHRGGSSASEAWGERDLNAQLCYIQGATGLPSLPAGSLCAAGAAGSGRWARWLRPAELRAGRARRLPLACKIAEVEEKLRLFESAGSDIYVRLFLPQALREAWHSSGGSEHFQRTALQKLVVGPGEASRGPGLFAEHGAAVFEAAAGAAPCQAMAAWLLQFRSPRSARAWEVGPEWRDHPTYFVKSNVDRDHFTLSLEEGPPGGPTVAQLLRSVLAGDERVAALVAALFSQRSVLWELAAFVAHPGAEAQQLHADVSAGHGGHAEEEPASITLQLLLTDVTPSHGGLLVWPGSHGPPLAAGTSAAERAWAQRAAAVAAASGNASEFTGVELAPLSAGAVVAYHSQLWHRGGRNDQSTPRVVLYVSLLSGGSPESMEQAANASAAAHHMALGPEYKRERRRLAELLAA